jgi:hypothetical protein
MQRATGNMRKTSSNMQRTTTTCNATECIMQHACKTRNKATRQHAADTAQKSRSGPEKARLGVQMRGDASDVAARRLHTSLACVHRWPTDVYRPRCGIRTRLGAREAHAVWFLLHPATLPASRDPMKPPTLSTMSLYSALAVRVLRRCFQCAATRVASWPCQACCRRATSRQAQSA